MGRIPDDIPDSELRVLEMLWEHGSETVRAITQRLYPDGGTSKRATVLKLLERLESKRLVRRNRSGPTQTFGVLADRDIPEYTQLYDQVIARAQAALAEQAAANQDISPDRAADLDREELPDLSIHQQPEPSVEANTTGEMA